MLEKVAQVMEESGVEAETANATALVVLSCVIASFSMAGQWTAPFAGLPTVATDSRLTIRELCTRDGKEFRAWAEEETLALPRWGPLEAAQEPQLGLGISYPGPAARTPSSSGLRA